MKERESELVKLWSHSSGLREKWIREVIGYKVAVAPDYHIWIAADLTVDGWDLRIKDDESFQGVLKAPGNVDLATNLGQWLQARQIEVAPHPRYQGHFSYGSHFPYDSDLMSVEIEIKGLLDLILQEH